MKSYLKKFVPHLNRKTIFIVTILGLFIVLHSILIWKNFIVDGSGNMRTMDTAFGDMPFHLTQVSKFAFTSFDLDEPIYTGTPLRYSFLINLVSGFLLRITSSWEFAMNAPLVLLAAASAVSVFLIYRKILRSTVGSFISMLIFYLGSGWAALMAYRDYAASNGSGWFEFISYAIDKNVSMVVRWGAEFPDQNVLYGAPISLVFSHQRSFILGFAIFCLFALLLLNLEKFSTKKSIILTAVAIGLIPFAHIQTFVVMLMVAGLYGLSKLLAKDYVSLKKILYGTGAGLLLTIPQLHFLTKNVEVLGTAQSFIKFRLGWMAQPTVGSVIFPESGGLAAKLITYRHFLWLNYGLILPAFMVAGICFLYSRVLSKDRTLLLWWVAAAAMLVTLNLIQFQPWDFDNNKFIVYFVFFLAPVIVGVFFFMLRNLSRQTKPFAIAAFAIIVGAIILSGVTDAMPRLRLAQSKQPTMFTKSYSEFAEFIRTNIPKDKLILTSSSQLNPVVSLAGRPVLLGYTGWLWTKGIDVSERESDIRKFYANPESNGHVVEKYGIDYILLDQMAIFDWDAPVSKFRERYELVYEKDNMILLKVR